MITKLFAPESYCNLASEVKAQLANGCGTGGHNGWNSWNVENILGHYGIE